MITRIRTSRAGSSSLIFPLVIAVCAFIVFSSARNNDFTNWDDREYVINNAFIKEINLKEEFKREYMGNYHPLTMISLALDYYRHEFNPKAYHETNIVLHILASLAAYLFVLALTENKITAFFASLLFAVHPMHVESVAWVSERKDLLYGLFLLCALWAYVKYLGAEGKTRWFAIFTIFFLLSLFSKAQAVVFPALCLLVDYFKGRDINRRNICEKTPLFVISLIFGFEAIHAQKTIESIQDSSMYSHFDRILFPGYGLYTYLWKLIAPLELSNFYPFPQKQNGSYPAVFYVAPLVSAAMIVIVWKFFRKKKMIIFGFMFFLLSISLVLKILPVGGAVIADRYTYIPYLGLFIIVADFLSPGLSAKGERSRNMLKAAIAVASVIIFSYLSYQRIGVWKNSVTLWRDAASKSKTSPMIYNNLGDAYTAVRQYESALIFLNEALRLKYDYDEALYNRGLVYYHQNNYKEAIDNYTLAIKYKPGHTRAYYNRSGTYYMLSQFQPALNDALKAKQLGYAVDEKYVEELRNYLREK